MISKEQGSNYSTRQLSTTSYKLTPMNSTEQNRTKHNESTNPRGNSATASKEPLEVSIRVKFLRLGEVMSLNEKFYAEVLIEARWVFDPSNSSWNPNLYVKNGLSDVKEEINSELVNQYDEPIRSTSNKRDEMIFVWEIRKICGTFWQKFDLKHFPVDVQPLSLEIVTRRSNDECILVENRVHPSVVDRDAFLAHHEWFLYHHIESRAVTTCEEFSFRPIRQSAHFVTCYVARRPGYFYWNIYLLIFLITLIGLSVHALGPDLPQYRLQINCTLLLISIMFRWSIIRLVPAVSYLTLLDRYTLLSLVFISLDSIWHLIIGFLIRHLNATKSIDFYVFIIFTLLFILYHVSIGHSFYCALEYRQRMLQADREYSLKLAGMFETFAQGHKAVQRFQNRQSSMPRALFI